MLPFTVDGEGFKKHKKMFYGCRRRRHFVSFHSESMIEFTVTWHNAVDRKQYLTIQSAIFTVGIDGFQTD